LNPQGDQGLVLGFGQGAKLKFSMPGTNSQVEIPSLLSFITFLQANTDTNILSTPQILALDNEEAEIEVGDTVPVSQDPTTNGSTTTVQTKFEKASIKLNITPYIRPDSEAVRMKINQSVKQPTKSTAVGEQLAKNTTIISDRSLKTNIVVHNGDTAILGGLIRDSEMVSETKVPLLGDIPVLGWLFKSRSINVDKINLVVFLTPKIIRNVQDSHEMLGQKTNDRIDWLKKNFDGRDPYGKKIDSLPRAAKAAADEEDVTKSGQIRSKSNKATK
jgi:general secretion pathway protein D